MPSYKGPVLYHPDGIKVTLIPKGKRNTTFRNPDLWQQINSTPTHDYAGRYLTCSIDHHDVEFEVEVVISGRFKMYDAKALNVGIGKGTCSPDDRVVASEDYTWKSAVAWKPLPEKFVAGAMVVERSWKMRLAMDARPHAGPGQGLVLDKDDEPYNMDLSPGSISVIVQRGKLKFLTNNYGRHLVCGVHYRKGSFERLQGDKGSKYLFEFCPRHGDNDEVVRNVPPAVPGIVPSSDQAEAGDSSDSEDESDNETSDPRRPGPPRPRRNASVAHRQKRKRRRQQPQICDCPVAHRPLRQSSLDADDASVAGARRGRGGAPNFRGNININTGAKRHKQGPEQEDGAPEEQERTAPTCTRCEKLKKPPTGKKIGWRNRSNRWMIMPRNAREDTPPFEEVDDEDSEAGDSAVDMESVNGDAHASGGEEQGLPSRSPTPPNLPSPARTEFWRRDGSDAPSPSEEDEEDSQQQRRQAWSETSGLFMTAEPSTPRRGCSVNSGVQRDIVEPSQSAGARSATPEEPDPEFEERVRRFRESRQKAHTILGRPARQPFGAFQAQIADMSRDHPQGEMLQAEEESGNNGAAVARIVGGSADQRHEDDQDAKVPSDGVAADGSNEQQHVTIELQNEQGDAYKAPSQPAHLDAEATQPPLSQSDLTDLGIKPERDGTHSPHLGSKRPGQSQVQSSPSKMARMDDQLTAAEVKKKKEESEEPEKKILPEFTMISIGTNEEPVSLLSEDEDEETREIAAVEKTARLRMRELRRKRNVRLMLARGVQAQVIE